MQTHKQKIQIMQQERIQKRKISSKNKRIRKEKLKIIVKTS